MAAQFCVCLLLVGAGICAGELALSAACRTWSDDVCGAPMVITNATLGTWCERCVCEATCNEHKEWCGKARLCEDLRLRCHQFSAFNCPQYVWTNKRDPDPAKIRQADGWRLKKVGPRLSLDMFLPCQLCTRTASNIPSTLRGVYEQPNNAAMVERNFFGTSNPWARDQLRICKVFCPTWEAGRRQRY